MKQRRKTSLQGSAALEFERLNARLSVAIARAERGLSVQAVHDLRVSARRVRTVLRALRRNLHPSLYDGLQFDLRNVMQAVGGLREASVRRQIGRALVDSADFSTDIGRGDRRQFKALLAERERQLQAETARLMASHRWQACVARINEGLHGPALVGLACPSAGAAGAEQLRRALKHVARSLSRPDVPGRRLHRARLRIKRARYLHDMVADLADARPDPTLADALRRLQNAYGAVNDHRVMQRWLIGSDLDPLLKRALVRAIKRRIAHLMGALERMRRRALPIVRKAARTDPPA